MPSTNDIKSILGSINATKSNIGKYLSVDSNMNPVWINAAIETAGESWVYQQVEPNTIVKLPELSSSKYAVIAIMRVGDGDGIVALEPNGTDTIMGVDGLWKSEISNEAFASIVLKAVTYNGIDIYGNPIEKDTWVIVNGVNTWSAGYTPTGTETIINGLTQIIGSNAISGGVGLTDIKFEKFGKLIEPLYTAKKGVPDASNKLVSYDTNNLFYKFNNTAGSDAKLFIGTRNYTNYLTQRAYDADTSDNSKNLTNSALSFGTVLSKSADNIGNVANTQWQKDNQKYCIVKSLTNFQWCDSNTSWTYLRGAQWRFRVNLENFRNVNDKPIKKIKHIFATLTIANERPKSGTYVYKVNKDFGEISSPADTQKNVIELFRYFLEEGNGDTTGDSTNNGTILTIPIEDNETEFDIVIESYQNNGSAYKTTAPDDSNNIEFLLNPNLLNIEFIGCDVGIDLSVSPDVEFDNLGTNENANTLIIGENLDLENKIEYAYLTNTNENPNNDGRTTTIDNTMIAAGGTIKAFTYDAGSPGIKTFFNQSGYFNPRAENSTISKTVLEYNCDISEEFKTSTNDAILGPTKITIDWFNAKYTITSNLIYADASYTCINSGAFGTNINLEYVTAVPATAAGTIPETITLSSALSISSLGISKIPAVAYIINGGTAESWFDLSMTITNYKTVYSEANNKYYEELINYRCGWEAAEGTWSEYISKPANPSEVFEQDLVLDGIPENKRQVSATDSSLYVSPSKQCIQPAHRQQIMAYTTGNTDYNAWYNSFSNSDYALLPYFAKNNDNTTSKYWAVRPIGTNNRVNNNTVIAFTNHTANTDAGTFAANQFCNLLINPTLSGTLFVDISVPFIGSYPCQLSYLIIKENLTTNIGYEFVCDSGNKENTEFCNNRDTGNITFTDNVNANNKYKYYIVLYGNYSQASFNGLIISRRSYNKDWNSTQIDWKNFFTQSEKINSLTVADYPWLTMNSIFGNPTTGTVTSRDTQFISKLSTLMFGIDDANLALIDTTPTPANAGSVFSFHAYVLRKN